MLDFIVLVFVMVAIFGLALFLNQKGEKQQAKAEAKNKKVVDTCATFKYHYLYITLSGLKLVLQAERE